jgi:hypothetical protein
VVLKIFETVAFVQREAFAANSVFTVLGGRQNLFGIAIAQIVCAAQQAGFATGKKTRRRRALYEIEATPVEQKENSFQ